MNKEELTLCKHCGCLTKSIESYEEIMKPKYKMITFLICGKCKMPKNKPESNSETILIPPGEKIPKDWRIRK